MRQEELLVAIDDTVSRNLGGDTVFPIDQARAIRKAIIATVIELLNAGALAVPKGKSEQASLNLGHSPELAPAPVALQIRAVAATPLRGAVRFRTSDGSEQLVEGEIGKGIRVPPGATILDFGLLSTCRPGDASPPTHSITGHLPNPAKDR